MFVSSSSSPQLPLLFSRTTAPSQYCKKSTEHHVAFAVAELDFHGHLVRDTPRLLDRFLKPLPVDDLAIGVLDFVEKGHLISLERRHVDSLKVRLRSSEDRVLETLILWLRNENQARVGTRGKHRIKGDYCLPSPRVAEAKDRHQEHPCALSSRRPRPLEQSQPRSRERLEEQRHDPYRGSSPVSACRFEY